MEKKRPFFAAANPATSRHRRLARPVHLPSEDPEAFDELRNSLIERLAPADPYELRLVRLIASCAWRLKHLSEMQTADLEHSIDRESASFDAYGEFPDQSYARDETTLLLQQRRALDLLRKSRQDRRWNLPAFPDHCSIPPTTWGTTRQHGREQKQ